MVFNSKGELALQLRAVNNERFPSYWDFSASGGIDEEEDDKSCAERELMEELGISADLKFISREIYTHPAWNPSITIEADISFFKALHDGPFNPDPNEVQKVEFFKLETIKEMIESGQKFHPEFITAWNKGLISSVAINKGAF